VAVIDQIRAVAKERLEKAIGMLSPEQMQAVEQALREILEIG
jgi:mRNA-degrading endonuclease toxin of MazEF toxin-antitoxin module